MSGIYNYEVAMDAVKFHKEALVKHFRGQADLYLEQAEQLIVGHPGNASAAKQSPFYYDMVWACDEALIKLKSD